MGTLNTPDFKSINIIITFKNLRDIFFICGYNYYIKFIKEAMLNLSDEQTGAINYFSKCALEQKDAALNTINDMLHAANLTLYDYKKAVDLINNNASIALHFHPDRLLKDKKNVVQSLLEQGIYKSQFETFISNGKVSSKPGGARDLWEKELFNSAYHINDIHIIKRPKYGALNLMQHSDGPSPRFGSCYFLLYPEVSRRSTFTYLDSYKIPDTRGTMDEFDSIMAELLEDIYFNEYAIGEKNITVPIFFDHVFTYMEKPFQGIARIDNAHNLNHYIEAQVHGDVLLERDVFALVADPSFKGTSTGDIFIKLCKKFSIKLYWHHGYTMSAHEVPDNFKGASMPSLAHRVAINNNITAYSIGNAAADLLLNPNNWTDRGSISNVLQELKYLWHVLVRFGKP